MCYSCSYRVGDNSVLIAGVRSRATGAANKALVLTAPALGSFGIIARHHQFGGGVGAFLPHTARVQRHNASVSALLYTQYCKKIEHTQC